MLTYLPSRPRRRQILAIALPIIGGMMSQNILNLVDIAMVRHLGDVALAATGIGGFANYMAIAFILGLAAGVQALAARRLGEGRHSETAVPLNGGLLLALILGLPLMIGLYLLVPVVFPWLTDDPRVIEAGVPYLQIRILAMVAVGFNFAFRGYWSAVHLTKLYLQTILWMHALNIFLNWVFIFGNLGAPEMGVKGAALASTLSVFYGVLHYFWLGWRHAREAGFLHSFPSVATLMQQLKISLPSSIQQLMFSAGLVVLIWILGLIGTAEQAAANVLTTLHLTAMLPAMGIALATATLVGNALGRGEPGDATRWGWNSAALVLLYGLVIAVLTIVLAKPILGVFIRNPDTLALAYWPLILWAAGIAADVAGLVIMQGLVGAGDTGRAMRISIFFQWVIFLPTAWLFGPFLGGGLFAVWAIFALYRVIQAAWLAHAWRQRKWQGIAL